MVLYAYRALRSFLFVLIHHLSEDRAEGLVERFSQPVHKHVIP